MRKPKIVGLSDVGADAHEPMLSERQRLTARDRTRMPRHWEPLPHEAKLFHEIYIDESSQNDHHYMVIGGIVVPRDFSAQLEEDLDQSKPSRLRGIDSKGNRREAGWKFVSTGDFEHYKKIVDTCYSFGARRLVGQIGMWQLFCSIIDLTVPGRSYTAGERGRVRFDRELYFHCLSIARRDKRHLWHVYPDERSTKRPARELGTIMSRGIAKERGYQNWAVRRATFRNSRDVQALQVSDIVIGAIAYYINGHYHKAGANRDKKLLCEHVLKTFKVWDTLTRGKMEKGFGPLILWFREHLKK